MRIIGAVLVIIAAALTNVSLAQSTNSVQAVTLLKEALAALGSPSQVADLTASGQGTWIVGTQQSATFMFRLKGLAESRLDITSGMGVFTELRNDTSGPAGEWLTPDGNVHQMPLHDCWTASGLFSPLSVLSSSLGSGLAIQYVGSEARNGLAVDHISVSRAPSANGTSANLTAHLSTIDIYLDQTSHLPWAVDIIGHPDNDASIDFPIELRFAQYQSVNGVLIPFRIQRVIGSTLNLDVTFSAVSINTGLSDNIFTLQ